MVRPLRVEFEDAIYHLCARGNARQAIFHDPRRDKRGFDLICNVLPFGRPWYSGLNDAVDYAKFRSRSHHAIIRAYDYPGNMVNRPFGVDSCGQCADSNKQQKEVPSCTC
jgi:hypothetical protein